MSMWCYCWGGRTQLQNSSRFIPPRSRASPIEISFRVSVPSKVPVTRHQPHAHTRPQLTPHLTTSELSMAVSARTSEFRQAVSDKENTLPEAKRRKLSRPAKRSTPESERLEALNKEYVKEAYNVVSTPCTRTISRWIQQASPWPSSITLAP